MFKDYAPLRTDFRLFKRQNVRASTTAANIGNHMVFKVNGRIFSEPVIRETIRGTSHQLNLSGDFSADEQKAVIDAVQSAQSK
jgi:preprotein translocase subunit SecD